ncbi:MAG: hypothetical protein N3C60_03220 [Calditerrivibrio sp.]|nr:hypothetical protein [Calditerrivibrio sp.]
MIIKSIDLSTGIDLVCNVNPMRSEIVVREDNNMVYQSVIAVMPAIDTSYRIVKRNPKFKSITDYVKGLLKIESILDTDDIVVRGTQIDGDRDFVIFTDKYSIETYKKKYTQINILEHEVSSLLRLLEYNKIVCSRLLHFNQDYCIEITFDGGYLKGVHVLDVEEVNDVDNALLSGFIPKGYNGPILNNPTNDPTKNVAFGGALYYFSSININFLQKESSAESMIFVSLTMLIAIFIVLNAALFVKTFFLNKKTDQIVKASIIELNKLNIKNAVDPLSQVKGVLANLKERQEKDLIPILDRIGYAVSQVKGINIYNMNATPEEIFIEGDAVSQVEVDDFKKRLPAEYNFNTMESVKDPKGVFKFKLRGKR